MDQPITHTPDGSSAIDGAPPPPDTASSASGIRHLQVVLAVTCCYLLSVTALLLLRLEAVNWGFRFGTNVHAWFVNVTVAHGIAAGVVAAAWLWARRRRTCPRWAPRVMLAFVPLLVLVSIDQIVGAYTPPSMIRHDAQLGWSLQPGWRGLYQNHPTSINAEGMRGAELRRSGGEGAHRVVLIGDSVAFGLNLRQEATLAGQLERVLNADADSRNSTNGAAGPWEVLNMGVPGYAAWQAVASLEPKLPRLAPEIVVYVACLNDVTDLHACGADHLNELTSATPGGLLNWSGIWRTVRIGARRHAKTSPDLKARLSGETLNAFAADPVDIPYAQWDCLSASLSRLAGLKARGIRTIVLCYPLAVQLRGARAVGGAAQEELARRAGEAGLEFIDLLPVFQSQPRRSGRVMIDSLHPSGRGNRIAAELLARTIRGE